jgi:hypothetical protein
MRALDYVLSMHEVCRFRSMERPPGEASGSELRRLVDQKAFEINGKRPTCNEEIELPVTSFIAFPKKRRTTIL